MAKNIIQTGKNIKKPVKNNGIVKIILIQNLF